MQRKLDQSRTFGTNYGFVESGAKYVQDGLDFDIQGECITTDPTSLEAADALIAGAVKPASTPAEDALRARVADLEARLAAAPVVDTPVPTVAPAVPVGTPPTPVVDDPRPKKEILVELKMLGGAGNQQESKAVLVARLAALKEAAAE